jgi:hypothetical protein
MDFSKRSIDSLAREAPRFKRAPKRSSIDRLASQQRSMLRRDLPSEVQACLVLLDECVRFFLHLERPLAHSLVGPGRLPSNWRVSRATFSPFANW